MPSSGSKKSPRPTLSSRTRKSALPTMPANTHALPGFLGRLIRGINLQDISGPDSFGDFGLGGGLFDRMFGRRSGLDRGRADPRRGSCGETACWH